MPKDITITYQGVPCQSVEFSRSLGVNPDVGNIIIPSDFRFQLNLQDVEVTNDISVAGKLATSVFPDFPNGDNNVVQRYFDHFGTLDIEHRDTGEQTRLTLDYIYISKGGITVEYESEVEGPNGRNKLYRVEICDERRLWKERGVIDKDFNIVYDKGKKFQGNSYESNSLKDGRLWTLEEIVNECVKNLPNHRGNPYQVIWMVSNSSATKKLNPLNIQNGGGKLAAEVLEKTLEQYDLYVALLMNGKIAVVEPNQEGAPFGLSQVFDSLKSNTTHIIRRSPKVQPNYLPEKVRVASSKRIIEELTLSTTGEGGTLIIPSIENGQFVVKTLLFSGQGSVFEPVIQDPLSGKWLTLNLDGPVVTFGEYNTGLTKQELDKEIWKSYDGEGFKNEKLKDKKDIKQALRKYCYRAWRMKAIPRRPILSNRTVLSLDNEIESAPIKALADYIKPKDNKDPSLGLWDNIKLGLPGDKQPQWDFDEGVVIFAVPVGRAVSKSGNIDNLSNSVFEQGAISITYQYESDRYYYYDLPKKPTNHTELIEVDWQAVQTPDYSNIKDLDNDAKDIIEKRYNQPEERISTEWSFSSVWPVENDGAVTQIAWSGGANSITFTTRVLENEYAYGLNGMPGIYTRVNHNVRR